VDRFYFYLADFLLYWATSATTGCINWLCKAHCHNKQVQGQSSAALVSNVRPFLLEMGLQFTFIGNQFKLQVDDKEYLVDIQLCHREL
jgi:hypothetical protein